MKGALLMDIYNLDKKSMDGIIKKFKKTSYGKRIGFLSNLPIFAMFFWAAVFAVMLFCKAKGCCYTSMPDTGAMIAIGFMLLSAASVTGMIYYRELRKFAEAEMKKDNN